MSNTPKRKISIPSRLWEQPNSVAKKSRTTGGKRIQPNCSFFSFFSFILRPSFRATQSFLISIRIETNLLTYDENFRFRLDVLPCPFGNILLYRTTFLVGCLMTRGLSLRSTSQAIETVLVIVVAVDAENGPSEWTSPNSILLHLCSRINCVWQP